jgi:integration host factor subunit alpha
MSINKERIIQDVRRTVVLSEKKSARSVETTLEIIKRTLGSNEDVLISGFGKFMIEKNSKRRGSRLTNSNAYIPGVKKVVTFWCSPSLIRKLNR